MSPARRPRADNSCPTRRSWSKCTSCEVVWNGWGRPVVDVLPEQVHARHQQHVELGQPPRDSRRQSGNRLAVERMVGRKRQPAVRVPGSENTGPPSRSATATNSATASASATRLPTRMAGFLGRASASAARRARRAAGAPDVERPGGVRSSSALGHLQIHRQGQKHRAGRRRRAPSGSARRRAAGIFEPFNFGGPFGPGSGDRDHIAPQDRLFKLQRRSCWPAVTNSGVPSR